jgi:CheY-like chemotaxis protein
MNQKKSKKTIVLAVDDYEPNLVALEVVLEGECEIIAALSGSEAIAILEKRQDIEVILMDVQMPIMDGYEASVHIKKMPNCEEIPIIFVTAIYKEDPFVKKGYAVGGIDYFSKPFDPDILRMKVGVYASFRQKAEILKTRERQIRETEELLKTGRKLSASLESLSVGVLISDVHGRICQMNEQVSRICKTVQSTDSDTYGVMLGWWDSDGKMLKEEDGPLFRAISKGETTHSQAMEIRCLDGSLKMIVGSASPLLGLDQHIVGAVVVIQDLTDSKKIEEDLELRISQLVSASVALDETIRN